MLERGDLSLAETFGLTRAGERWDEAKMALGGDPFTPPSRWGVSSLGIFKPRLSVKTWLGWRPEDRRVPLYNLFNRTPTPTSEGWSVRKTQVRDFLGGTRTYDSHNGTDFAIPAGTFVVASAPGYVRRVSDEFHRGGLKVTIDHGHGVITTSNHLGRSLVSPGDFVRRGQRIAISAYSGIDAIVCFPWSVPHVHFNTWLNGRPVDPFARDGEVSLWQTHNSPTPFDEENPNSEPPPPTQWDICGLADVINGCVDPDLRQELRSIPDLDRRAIDTIFMKNYFPTRFSVDENIYADEHPRKPLLDLPFRAQDYVGVRFV